MRAGDLKFEKLTSLLEAEDMILQKTQNKLSAKPDGSTVLVATQTSGLQGSVSSSLQPSNSTSQQFQGNPMFTQLQATCYYRQNLNYQPPQYMGYQPQNVSYQTQQFQSMQAPVNGQSQSVTRAPYQVPQYASSQSGPVQFSNFSQQSNGQQFNGQQSVQRFPQISQAPQAHFTYTGPTQQLPMAMNCGQLVSSGSSSGTWMRRNHTNTCFLNVHFLQQFDCIGLLRTEFLGRAQVAEAIVSGIRDFLSSRRKVKRSAQNMPLCEIWGLEPLSPILRVTILACQCTPCGLGSSICYVALHPQVNGVSGEYFSDSNIGKQTALAPYEELAKKLWVSRRLSTADGGVMVGTEEWRLAAVMLRNGSQSGEAYLFSVYFLFSLFPLRGICFAEQSGGIDDEKHGHHGGYGHHGGHEGGGYGGGHGGHGYGGASKGGSMHAP
ncbi:hypothetical protein Vadar_014612 [Vaccinium darrowii]|uniref:Uncharacterized protein n=1 Tax=Vaccinium darrowii TaxID=229202 RepID=A0ACB7XHJ2_9ERIC|nr:hypothetical protein Vadar_014612 [Vaccinium darrowii]